MVPLAALGQEHPSGQWYANADVGAAFEQQLRIRRSGELIDFHNGIRGDLAVGYQYNSWIAGELTSGAIWNSVQKIGGVPVTSFSTTMDLYQMPILADVVLSTPTWHGFRPYLGGGFGGVAALLNLKRPLGDISDTDFEFAYQAFAGLNYQVCRRAEIGVGYKYLATESHSWIQNGVTLDTAGTGTHSVTASVTIKF